MRSAATFSASTACLVASTSWLTKFDTLWYVCGPAARVRWTTGDEFAAFLQRQHGRDLGRRRAEHRIHHQFAEFGRRSWRRPCRARGGRAPRRPAAARRGLRHGRCRRSRPMVGREIARLAEPLADLEPVDPLAGGGTRLGRGGQLGEFVDEHEPGAADANLVERAEATVRARSVSPLTCVPFRLPRSRTYQPSVPGRPRRARGCTGRPCSSDLVGRRAAELVPHAVLKRVDVAEPVVAAGDEKRTRRLGHERRKSVVGVYIHHSSRQGKRATRIGQRKSTKSTTAKENIVKIIATGLSGRMHDPDLTCGLGRRNRNARIFRLPSRRIPPVLGITADGFEAGTTRPERDAAEENEGEAGQIRGSAPGPGDSAFSFSTTP